MLTNKSASSNEKRLNPFSCHRISFTLHILRVAKRHKSNVQIVCLKMLELLYEKIILLVFEQFNNLPEDRNLFSQILFGRIHASLHDNHIFILVDVNILSINAVGQNFLIVRVGAWRNPPLILVEWETFTADIRFFYPILGDDLFSVPVAVIQVQ